MVFIKIAFASSSVVLKRGRPVSAGRVTESRRETDAEGGNFVGPQTFPTDKLGTPSGSRCSETSMCPFRVKRGCIVRPSAELLLLRGLFRDGPRRTSHPSTIGAFRFICLPPFFVCVRHFFSAGGRWTFDWEAMETAMKENPEVALFMLCNPYNPVGEAPIYTELKGGGSREREGGDHVRCFVVGAVAVCQRHARTLVIFFFLSPPRRIVFRLSQLRHPRLWPGADTAPPTCIARPVQLHTLNNSPF